MVSQEHEFLKRENSDSRNQLGWWTFRNMTWNYKWIKSVILFFFPSAFSSVWSPTNLLEGEGGLTRHTSQLHFLNYCITGWWNTPGGRCYPLSSTYTIDSLRVAMLDRGERRCPSHPWPILLSRTPGYGALLHHRDLNSRSPDDRIIRFNECWISRSRRDFNPKVM